MTLPQFADESDVITATGSSVELMPAVILAGGLATRLRPLTE
jgi:hypothetical protein